MEHFHHNWRFCLSDTFPMSSALEVCRDEANHLPTDSVYDDTSWEQVTLPHTFNGQDLFATPIEDAGSGQRRCCAFYRNRFTVPPEHRGDRAILVFEGVRQTCYVYVNGTLAGYYEMGVGPFAFDITKCLQEDGDNVIAIATDNTSTRNIPFCIAETPNKPGVMPGSYLFSQDEKVPEAQEGVGFFWNCNDFNPTLGGISQPLSLVWKRGVHLTLPMYANLRSHGTYVYADDFDFARRTARIHVEAEVRNATEKEALCGVTAEILTPGGELLASFSSQCQSVAPQPSSADSPLTLVPEDAYRWDENTRHYVAETEDAVAPTVSASVGCQVIQAVQEVPGLDFWEPSHPALYLVRVTLHVDGEVCDRDEIVTGFRHVAYDPDQGVLINGRPVFLRGYAQRATNEWAQTGIVPEWMHDADARLIRESGANHIRWMHVAASPMDIRACDRQGIVCTQPAGDKERENFGRQWDQRVELMRNIIIAYRNHPSILFWEAGNNVISTAHMREMRLLRLALDPHGGRFMGCRTINTEDTLLESEYVGTMLNRHAARFLALHGPITETEYSREEAPRRVWDDYTPPDFDYRNRFLGKGGRKQKGLDFYDLTSEDLALSTARGYSEFFFDRIGGASGKNLYSACAALCWTDSAQHGRQSFSENGRMSGRVDAMRVRKQSFDVFRVMHAVGPLLKILGHWNYPPLTQDNYRTPVRRFNGSWWEETDQAELHDPRHKTVYCVGSYPVASVSLSVNGRPAGRCDHPDAGFIFAFPDIDVTEQGFVEAAGYDIGGLEICRDRIETAGAPFAIRLTSCCSPQGWQADGRDLCYVDVEVVDVLGRVCPLADMRIDFTVSGPALFLGGYNSGRFDGNGRSDSVVGKSYVYAECGTNRVLLQSLKECGTVTLRASSRHLAGAAVTLTTCPCDTSTLTPARPMFSSQDLHFDPAEDAYTPIPELDRIKYEPETENYCKILVCGQEPDARGVRAVNRNGSIWGNVLCVLERMKQTAPDRFEYTWDPSAGQLTLTSSGHTAIARVGVTHLLLDGRESLMDGQPYVTEEGVLVMEVNAIAPQVADATAQFDERVGVLRIEL